MSAVGDVITTVEELDALPERSVVLDRDGDAWQYSLRWQCTVGTARRRPGELVASYGPLIVLHIPTPPPTVVDVLLAHQRQGSSECLCGPRLPGSSHAEHVAEQLRAAGLLAGDAS